VQELFALPIRSRVESGIVIIEDHVSLAIFADTNKSAALDLSKNFVTEILGIHILSFEEKVNYAKAD
jgi:hypothetical protein